MNKKGFTLVELLAVIVIVALIGVFAMTSGFGIFDNTKDKINEEQAKSIQEGLELFLMEVKEENCMDENNVFFEDAAKILKVNLVDVNSCQKLRNYIAKKLFESGSDNSIEITIDGLLDSGYVTGYSIEDFENSNEISIKIEGTGEQNALDSSKYEIVGELQVVLNYEKKQSEENNDEFVFYVDGSSGNNSNDGKMEGTPFKTIENAIQKSQNNNLTIYLLSDYTLTSNISFNKNLKIVGNDERKELNIANNNLTIAGDLIFDNLELKQVSNSILEKAQSNSTNTIVIYDFDFTNAVQSISTPITANYKLEVWGAQGGGQTSYPGGKGGYSKGTISLSQNTNLYIYVGGEGDSKTGTQIISESFNGGGRAYTGKNNVSYMGAGGGATDIRISSNDLKARVIVAGGGGGSGKWSTGTSYISTGGYGGGSSGGDATGTHSGGQNYGKGGTSNFPGNSKGDIASAFGVGGGAKDLSSSQGGGGGGWYGGGSGLGNGAGGGGGSGYVYTESTASYCPPGCLLTSNYYLTDAETIAGDQLFRSPNGDEETGHSGNGYARITLLLG